MRQIVNKCRVSVGGILVQTRPIHIQSRSDLRTLIELLADQERLLPVIIASGDERASNPADPLIDVNALTMASLGLSLVVVVPAEHTYALSDAFGKTRSVYYGAVRTYLRGFDESSDPHEHRLFLSEFFAHDPVLMENEIRRFVARESVLRTRLGPDLVTFASVRSATAQQKQQEASRASEAEQLAAAHDRIEALTVEVQGARDERDQFLDLAVEEETRRKRAEALQYGLKAQVATLRGELERQGFDPDAGIQCPEEWGDLIDWCDEALVGRVVLASQARRGIRKAKFEDPELAARCLLRLASDVRERRLEGGGILANMNLLPGIENAPCGNDSFRFDWQGRRMTADWHIKSGGNTRDPRRCLRIYYCFDDLTQQIVVADMPAHRRTGAS